MKTITLLVLIFTVYTVKSQDLIKNISEDATFIVSLNGEKLLNQISEAELENSLLFKELSYEMFKGKAMAKPSRFSEMGVNVHDKMYFALEIQDDMSFYYFTYKIQDLTVFEKFIKSGDVTEDSFSQINGLNVLTYDYDNKLYWNKDYAIYIRADYNGRNFKRSYGYGGYDDYDYDSPQEAISYEVEEEKCEGGKCDGGDIEMNNVITDEDLAQLLRENEEKKLRQEELEAERIRQNEELRIKNEVIRLKKEQYIIDKINFRVADFYSVKHNYNDSNAKDDDNKDKAIYKYVKGLEAGLFDNEAVVSLYYSSKQMYNNGFPSYSRYGLLSNMFGWKNNLGGNYISNLFLEADKISIKTDVLFPELFQKSFAKIYKSKINKQLISYVPGNVLGYWSFSMNTEDLLVETQLMTQDFFDSSKFEYAEEMSLYIDLIGVMLDEKEIANLITGDGLIMFNDLDVKNVTYETYDYDEDFNSTKVTKTKQELLPEFTLMIGSENERIINKIFKLGVKHEILVEKNSYFMLTQRFNETPYQMYLAFKDDIIFTTNSINQIANIINGKAEVKLESVHKKRMKKNLSASYLNINACVEKMMLDESLAKEMGLLFDLKDDLRSFYSSSKFNTDKLEIDTYIEIPNGEKSSAYYLLNLIDKGIGYNSK